MVDIGNSAREDENYSLLELLGGGEEHRCAVPGVTEQFDLYQGLRPSPTQIGDVTASYFKCIRDIKDGRI